jgi:hypothetical protein
MTANRVRGEIDAELGGRRRRLVLTLGALAELEGAYGAEGMAALAARLSGGGLSAGDAVRVIGAGLRGAGEAVDDGEVAAMATPGGAVGFARIVVELLTATFGGEGAPAEAGGNPPPVPRAASSPGTP